MQLIINRKSSYATDGVARYEVVSSGVLWFAVQHRRMLRKALAAMKVRIGKRIGRSSWELIQGI